MGGLLKQVLATLCGVNQWSYAAFWKIGIHNSKLLIWEECYYKPNPELPSADRQGCWASDAHSSQLQDPVHMLINKMISNNQVNLVGQGLVGRAAFTGNHVWILSNNYTRDAHPPEVLSEIRHQFSAGMQTIAVIPVSLHGVVQLGSSLSIMENVGFVNNVKSLIMQLGCVPGALLSDSFVVKESAERIGVPVSFGAPDSVSSCLCGNEVDNCHRQGISSLSSGIIQPSYSQITQMQDPPQAAASTIHASNVTASLPISYSRHSEPKMAEAMKTFDSSVGELSDRGVAAEVVPSNPGAWMNQHSASFNSLPAASHQSVIDQFDVNNNVLMSLEQQVLSGVTQQNLGTNGRNELDCYIPSQMKSSRGLVLNSCGGSSESGKELNNGVNKQLRSTSVLFSCLNPQNSARFNNSSTQLAGVEIQDLDSLRIEEIPLSSLANQLSGSRVLSGGSYHRLKSSEVKQSSSEPIAKKEKMDDDLFQVLNIIPTQANEHTSLDEHMSGSVVNCSKHGNESQSTKVSDFEDLDSYTRAPPGDDLYDALGADFKSRLLSSKWDDMLVDGECANAHTSKTNSTFMNVQEASSDFFAVSHKKFDSSIFSSTTTDNLLDAVVSRAQSTAKRCSDDDVSCKTTLTKISSSSVASSSSMYGPADIADQVHKGLRDLPKSIENSGPIVTSSFRSGCSKDDVGSCSQSTSAYGSQLSSWIGHNMRSDSSISTAYSKKNDEMTKPNRKRLKPGENPRPRPKDRQMIQDRMKELREIVPNGAKLSIDALLERTIKHMLFLQSVTKHADKLKQTGESKIMKKEGGLLSKDSFEGGATWAFEVGSQSMVCPIIVEDLNPPRQMLVEMLCEERGLFLEIADLIRGLGLTILKGVMEAWNDKIWARFAVEANRDVTRMEVFMSLVRLLEQPAKGTSPSTAALENDNMTVHHAFPQTTSIAVNGRPSSLQ